MNKEEFINSKIKLSKEDIIEDYYKTEENLVKYLGIEHENYELQQENKNLKDKIPRIIQNNSCRYISIEKCKNKVCVNYKMQELEGSDNNVKD